MLTEKGVFDGLNKAVESRVEATRAVWRGLGEGFFQAKP